MRLGETQDIEEDTPISETEEFEAKALELQRLHGLGVYECVPTEQATGK